MGYVAIIDDSLVVRKIVEISLNRAGIACLGFRDGHEAFRMLQYHATPELFLLDINLPGALDGFDLLRILKKNPRFSTIPVVMLSARTGVLDRMKGRLAGAHAYLAKPFRIEELLAIVLPVFLKPMRLAGSPGIATARW